MFLISIGTQLFTLPLVLYYFGYVSIVAPIVNIVVVPLAGLALGAGVAGVVFMALPLLPEWFGGGGVYAVMVRRMAGAPYCCGGNSPCRAGDRRHGCRRCHHGDVDLIHQVGAIHLDGLGDIVGRAGHGADEDLELHVVPITCSKLLDMPMMGSILQS